MTKVSGSEIRDVARKIIARSPKGIRGSALNAELLRRFPDMTDAQGKPSGTIRGATWDLDRRFPSEIVKGPNGFAPKR